MEQRFDYENVGMNLSKSRRVSDSLGIRRNEVPSFDFYGSLERLVWPVIPEEREKDLTPVRHCPLAVLFHHMKPEYSDDVTEKPDIEIGKYFDVVSLLSCNYNTNHLFLLRNNGDQVQLKKDAFKDKNLMICCFNVPVFRGDFNSTRVQALANLCSDLYALNPDKFEMVVVLKIHSLANHQQVFDHFLSGFPSSCLAVPFSYSNCRDYICNYLNLGTLYGKCLILDGASNVLYSDIPHFVPGFGAEAFPFTPEHTHDLFAKDFPLWESRPMSTLEGLLQCDSSLVLDKIDSVQETVSISKLKQKVIGLYLYVGGEFSLDLNEIYEQCRANHLDFEIVLVYLPFADCLEPQASQDKIDRLLQNHNISWWRVPFNDSVSRRLFRLVASSTGDVLVILGPHDSYVDPCGREVMRSYGISGFPFTREALIERELRKLQELTLESLLVYQSRNYVFHHDEKVPVEKLRQRNVLLYFGCLQNLDLYYNLRAWYPKLKEKDSSYEVVFVRRAVDYYAEHTAEDDAAARSIMRWFVCPFNLDHSNSVQEKLFTQFSPCDTLIQFGADGRICSVEAQELLQAHGTDAFPFNNNLRQDIISRLKSKHEFMRSYE